MGSNNSNVDRREAASCLWEPPALPEVLGPRLRDTLAGFIQRVKADGVPLPPSIFPFEDVGAIRPSGHRRCYYLKLSEGDGGGYIAIKGCEPFLLHQLEPLARTRLPLARMGELTAMDFYPLREHKVPMAVTRGEAVDEAERAHAVYTKYVARYREAPLLPVPLLAARWPDEVASGHHRALAPLLSPFANEAVERLTREGLGCFLYHYPVAPFPRVRHFVQGLGAEPARWVERLEAIESPLVTVERWVRLFARMLAVGFVPAITSQGETGFTVQFQNVVVGGGFVDLDSVIPAEAFLDDYDFHESYMLATVTLVTTIAFYLFGYQDRHQGANTSFGWLRALLHFQDVLARVLEEDRKTYGEETLHPRMRAWPPFNRDPAGLLELMRVFHARPDLGELCQKLDGQG